MLDGFEACRAGLAQEHPSIVEAEVLACSSAGGGLRVAVIGNEELVTAEAGRRVALSSGGKVVAVLSRVSDDAAYRELARTTRPDVVLLTGGTDGGDEDGVLAAATRLAASGWVGPVVMAGNSETRAEVLSSAGRSSGGRGGERGAEDRGARTRLGSPGHPRGLPGARDRRQAAEQPGGLPGDGAGCHARPGAHRCRGPRASQRARTSRSWTSVGPPPTCTRRCGSIPRRPPGSRVRSWRARR